MHLQSRLLHIATHITQWENNHSIKNVGTNNCMDQYGSRHEISMEARLRRIQEKHGNTNIENQILGTTRINIQLIAPRKWFNYVSTFLFDGWILVHGTSLLLFLVVLIMCLYLIFLRAKCS